jgi:16S rRNA (cytidine1402-2'-O)-methyltransferase
MHNFNAIYLISLPIGEFSLQELDSSANTWALKNIKYWVAESAKTLRRYISSTNLGVEINDLKIIEWDKHGLSNDVYQFLDQNSKENNIAIVSDAGIPGVADPGGLAVAWAHSRNLPVIPVVGASSLMLALSASGLNGQSFKFHGYLPVKSPNLKRKLSQIVSEVGKDNTAQMFIETPYRNQSMFDLLLEVMPANMAICIAFDIHGSKQLIKTQSAGQWKKNKPEWVKAPCVFILGHILQR